jgi:hypothetical protein
MTAPVWPRVAGRTCHACGTRRVVCTWFADARLLCDECVQMPSRLAMFTPSIEEGS